MPGFRVAFGIVQCPACDWPLEIWGMRKTDEPELMTATCTHCQTKLESRIDPATGRRVITKAWPS